MQLQQQHLAVQAKLDRAYDDRLATRITDELWVRKSGSHSTFDRGSLSVAYVKPVDLLVEGNETEDWLGGRDSN